MIYSQHIDRINSDLNNLLEQEIEEEIRISDEKNLDKIEKEIKQNEF